jgi:hypothetical protein
MPDDRTQALLDRLELRELVNDWAMWRDMRRWDKFAELWHEGGVMMTTWGGRTTPQGFMEAAEAGYQRGDRMLHSNGGVTVELAGDRAIVHTKLRIMQRAVVDGVLCDATCLGRDYDFCEKREGRWGLVCRQPIYERDSLVVVNPADSVDVGPEQLATLPDGYARLGYMQAGLGYEIGLDLPTLDNDAVHRLYEAGAAWLRGEPLAW